MSRRDLAHRVPLLGVLATVVVTAWLLAPSGYPAVGPPSAAVAPLPRAQDPAPLGATATPALAAGTAEWTNVSTSGGPQVRCCASMAYDARDGYTVLFGGYASSCPDLCNQTWILRNGLWSEVFPKRSPSPREWASMVYDPFDGYVLLFGGLNDSQALSDTWAYSNGSWDLVQTSNGPPGRWAAGLSADLSDGYLLLFGGFNDQGFLQDSWSFVQGSWTQLSPSVSPPARWAPGMAYDPEEGGVLLFGGYDSTAGFLGDTWLYSGGSWRQLNTPTSPAPREKVMMDYDAADQAVVMFGGDSCPLGCISGHVTRYYNDTWAFADGTWSNVTSVIGPSPQCCGALSYVWDQGQLVLQSSTPGTSGNLTTWTLTLSPPPSGRPQVLALEALPPAPTTAQLTTFLVEARPSLGTLYFRYRGLPPSCLPLDSPVISCDIVQAGAYTVRVWVTDATGNNSTGVFSVSVTAAPAPPFLPLSNGQLAILVAVVIIVVALAALFVLRIRLARGSHRARTRAGTAEPSKHQEPESDPARRELEPKG